MKRALVIEDDPHIRAAIVSYLKDHIEVQGCEAVRLSEVLEQFDPQAILLSYQASDALKEQIQSIRLIGGRYIPVVVVTSEASPSTLRQLYSAGADAFLVRPFDFNQMHWLMQMISRLASTDVRPSEVAAIDNVKLDLAQRRIIDGDRSFPLTGTQVSLLNMFIKHPDRLFARTEIKESLKSKDRLSDRSVDAFISKLKNVHPILAEKIHTVYGKGYVWSSVSKIKKRAAV